MMADESIWKEVVVAKSRYYPEICPNRQRRSTRKSVTITHDPAGIRTYIPGIQVYKGLAKMLQLGLYPLSGNCVQNVA
jgi:hypothetical protein